MERNLAWESEIRKLSAIEIFNHATLEMYHGGTYPEPDTFCGKCWQMIRNETPGERLIDWEMFEDDIQEIIEALNHYNSSKNHPDYILLSTKLTVLRAKKTACLLNDVQYTDLEITTLSFVPNGKRLEIPSGTFIHNYSDVKSIMKNFGGKYSKNGFEFTYPAEDVLNRIRNKETTNLKKSYQFFGTPMEVCDELCKMTFDPYLNKNVKILEPSAGQGAIIDSIAEWFSYNAINIELESITAVEYMIENYNFIKEKYVNDSVIKIHNNDFLTFESPINHYDYIIANPPFSGGQDIQHFYKMYELLKPGGVLTCIMSTGWMNNSQKKFKKFRSWLGLNDDEDKFMLNQASKGIADYSGVRTSENKKDERISIKCFDSGTFKESGTNVVTCVVQITKNDLSGFSVNTDEIQENKQLELF